MMCVAGWKTLCTCAMRTKLSAASALFKGEKLDLLPYTSSSLPSSTFVKACCISGATTPTAIGPLTKLQLHVVLVTIGLGGLQQSSYGALQSSLLAIDTLVITTSACTISPLLLWADVHQFRSNGRRHRPSPATPASTHTRCRAHALH